MLDKLTELLSNQKNQMPIAHRAVSMSRQQILERLFYEHNRYECFDRKRAVVKYQSQSVVIKVMALVSHLKKPLNFKNSNF